MPERFGERAKFVSQGLVEPSSFPGSPTSSRSGGRGGEKEILGMRL